MEDLLVAFARQIGQLGAIAVIRTFLNYFLEKDLEGKGRSTYRSASNVPLSNAR
jgi:uncharacterized membrane protein